MKAWVENKPNLLQITKISTADNKDLCHRIMGLHEYAYSWSANGRISSAFIESYIDEAERHSLLERDIVRSFVNILDICQQHLSCNPSQELSLVSDQKGRLSESEIYSYESSFFFKIAKTMIDEVLLTLTLRERRVIQLRFGLDDEIRRTLEEIGREFKVTRERIRQIEAKALRKLRHPSRSRKLKDILDSDHLLDKGYENLLRAIFGEHQ